MTEKSNQQVCDEIKDELIQNAGAEFVEAFEEALKNVFYDMDTREFLLNKCDRYCEKHGIHRGKLAFEGIRTQKCYTFFSDVEKGKGNTALIARMDNFLKAHKNGPPLLDPSE